MNDLEQRLKDVLETDAAKAPRVARAPEGLERDIRRRQVGTALIGTFAIVAVLGVSLAGLRLIDRSEATTPVDDTWTGYEIFERTAQIENFTITSPSDLYLVNQWPWSIDTISGLRKAAQRAQDDCKTTPRGQARRDCMDATFGPGSGTVAPIFQLSNTDRGLRTSPCMGPGLIAPNEIVLTVSYDYLSSAANFGAGDEPPWPVTYTEDADYGRTPCGPGVYVPFASPEVELGSYPYVAHILAGAEVSDEDRQAVIEAFNTMDVGGIERFDAGDQLAEPAYVLAGGENTDGAWRLDLAPQESPGYISNVQLELVTNGQRRETAGGPFTISSSSPIEQTGSDPVFGAVSVDATGVELRSPGEQSGPAATLVPLPPSMPFDFNLFFAGNPTSASAQAVALDVAPASAPTKDPGTPDPSVDHVRTVATGSTLGTTWTLQLDETPGEFRMVLVDDVGDVLASLEPEGFDALHSSGLEYDSFTFPRDGRSAAVVFGAAAPAAAELAIGLDSGASGNLHVGDLRWDPLPVLTSSGEAGLRLWWFETRSGHGELATFTDSCERLARQRLDTDTPLPSLPSPPPEIELTCGGPPFGSSPD